jgi:hypothetical protein
MKERRLVGDRQLIMGAETLMDGLDRFRTYGHAEVAATLAAAHLSMSSINSFCAYNRDLALDYAEEVGKLHGMDGFVQTEEFGVSMRERTDVLAKSGGLFSSKKKYQSYLTLFSDPTRAPARFFDKDSRSNESVDTTTGRVYMWLAYKNLVRGMKLYETAWRIVES